MAARREIAVDVDGRSVRLSNLDKVLFPGSGVTKAAVIDYYRRVAPVMLPHLRGRPLTMIRFPDGVTGESFFEKQCPRHRPDWVATVELAGRRKGPVRHCAVDDLPTLVWVANLAALELHVTMARCPDVDHPDTIVFDLDPGPPAGLAQAASVALDLRGVLADLGLEAVPKTSGKKGLHCYVPIEVDGGPDHETARAWARALARHVESARDDVVTVMSRSQRPGKVFIDWSQNAKHKTTVAPYSLRALDPPTVSTPLGWHEVEALADGVDPRKVTFGPEDVLHRVEAHGDLFESVVALRQAFPRASPGST